LAQLEECAQYPEIRPLSMQAKVWEVGNLWERGFDQQTSKKAPVLKKIQKKFLCWRKLEKGTVFPANDLAMSKILSSDISWCCSPE